MLTVLMSSWCLFLHSVCCKPSLSWWIEGCHLQSGIAICTNYTQEFSKVMSIYSSEKDYLTSCLIDLFIKSSLWSGHLKDKNPTLSIILVILACAIWISRARWGILQFFHSLSSLIPVHCSLDLTGTSFYRATLNRNTKEVLWHIPSIEVHALSYLKVSTVLLVMWRS